jgi:hypothetical protein
MLNFLNDDVQTQLKLFQQEASHLAMNTFPSLTTNAFLTTLNQLQYKYVDRFERQLVSKFQKQVQDSESLRKIMDNFTSGLETENALHIFERRKSDYQRQLQMEKAKADFEMDQRNKEKHAELQMQRQQEQMEQFRKEKERKEKEERRRVDLERQEIQRLAAEAERQKREQQAREKEAESERQRFEALRREQERLEAERQRMEENQRRERERINQEMRAKENQRQQQQEVGCKQPTCPSGHSLRRGFLPIVRCDECQRQFSSTNLYGCRPCNYDVCDACKTGGPSIFSLLDSHCPIQRVPPPFLNGAYFGGPPLGWGVHPAFMGGHPFFR